MRGRPLIPTESRRCETIKFRVTTEELRQIEGAAQNSGVKLSEFTRVTMLQTVKLNSSIRNLIAADDAAIAEARNGAPPGPPLAEYNVSLVS